VTIATRNEHGAAASPWIRQFQDVGSESLAEVGGKNASLGEMLRGLSDLGVRIPDGFAVTAAAYRAFLRKNDLERELRDLLEGMNCRDVELLESRAAVARAHILAGSFPAPVAGAIRGAYRQLSAGDPQGIHVAVRSSATAEDLPTASFAGQQKSFLHVRGEAELLETVRRCFASLFTARAVSYREDMGFDHFDVALSVGVQRMARADATSSGVIFTLETDSGFREVVYLTSIYGLGENIVQGRVGPDEFYVHKPTLREGRRSILRRKLGSKELRLAYDQARHRLENRPVPAHERDRFSQEDGEILQLARWALSIEDHYSRLAGRPTPMDIEWAKDAPTGELFIVQARPETVHSQRLRPVLRLFSLPEQGECLVEGLAVGDAVAVGPARIIRDPSHMKAFQQGDVLVTQITDPDWEPILKLAAAVVTERGGRTSHAAIVARELGIPALVGASDARRRVAMGEELTVSCAEGEVGRVYRGRLPFGVEEIDPSSLPKPRTRVILNLADPERAFAYAQLPCDGVGLVRMEFIFTNWVKVHPLALTRYESLPEHLREEVAELTRGWRDRKEYLVDVLTQGIATLAAAFWPRPVIMRFSDFKTNEYARLLGGAQFEPHEENPMLGWRGASRYYHPSYQEGFLLEVATVKRVRQELGLTNLKVMVPFCRTPAEGRAVLEAMRAGGLERGENRLEVYVMAEIPANVLLARDFAEVFDGFSIGSNDLTQLVLGVDRDSEWVAELFDERNGAVRRACAMIIEAAHQAVVQLESAARHHWTTRSSRPSSSGRGSTRSASARTRWYTRCTAWSRRRRRATHGILRAPSRCRRPAQKCLS